MRRHRRINRLLVRFEIAHPFQEHQALQGHVDIRSRHRFIRVAKRNGLLDRAQGQQPIDPTEKPLDVARALPDNRFGIFEAALAVADLQSGLAAEIPDPQVSGVAFKRGIEMGDGISGFAFFECNLAQLKGDRRIAGRHSFAFQETRSRRFQIAFCQIIHRPKPRPLVGFRIGGERCKVLRPFAAHNGKSQHRHKKREGGVLSEGMHHLRNQIASSQKSPKLASTGRPSTRAFEPIIAPESWTF